MKIVKPTYYDEFQCTASKCPITCCQEWKISVDDETYKKWKSLTPPDTMKTRKKELKAFTTYKDNVCIIGLGKGHRCPFLNADKLCNIVSAYGDDKIPETCRVFPREIHEYHTRTEYSLMPCCPEVVDMLNRLKRFEIVEVDEEKEEKTSFLTEEGYLRIRDFFCDMAQKEENTPEKNLLMIYFMALDILHSGFMRDDMEAAEYLVAMEHYTDKGMLKELSEGVDKLQFEDRDAFQERNELLLDIAENYRKEGLYRPYLDEITLYAEELTQNYNAIDLNRETVTFWKAFEEYRPLMRKLLAAEIYADSMLPDGNMITIVTKLQWLAMEFTVICHILFLHWVKHKELPYEKVRDTIVIISRMMGYEEEDVTDYLKNSFEKLIWDFGYFAMIVGNGES